MKRAVAAILMCVVLSVAGVALADTFVKYVVVEAGYVYQQKCDAQGNEWLYTYQAYEQMSMWRRDDGSTYLTDGPINYDSKSPIDVTYTGNCF